MDRSRFFAIVQTLSFGGSLTASQVKGMEALLDASAGLDADEIAYILSTAFHETAETMRRRKPTSVPSPGCTFTDASRVFKPSLGS